MEAWGCEPSEEVAYVCFPGTESKIELNSCPMGYLTSDLGIVFRLYDQWAAGRMPYDGGYMQQPQRLIEAFAVIDHYLAEDTEKK